MTSPVVTFVINPRSRRKYDQLVSGLEQVLIVLEDAEAKVSRLGDRDQVVSARTPSPDELLALVRRSMTSLENMRSRVIRGQAELLAQEWRF